MEEERQTTFFVTTEFDGYDVPCELSMDNFTIVVKPIGNPAKVCTIPLVGVVETSLQTNPSLVNNRDTFHTDSQFFPVNLCLVYVENVFDSFPICKRSIIGAQGSMSVIKASIDVKSVSLRSSLRYFPPKILSPTENQTPNLISRKSIALIQNAEGIPILNNGEIDALRLLIPSRLRMVPWKQKYKGSINGMCLDRVFQSVSSSKPLVLVISSDDDVKFGAFLTDGIQIGRGFSGGGETFVFTFKNLIDAYRWSHQNPNFIYANRRELIIGGSSSSGSAIYIEENLLDGFSDECDTFDSPTLTLKPEFRIRDMEIWHLSSR